MKKVFIISHALTEPLNQKRWFDFAELCSDWKVNLLIPKIWKNSWFGNEQEITTSPLLQNNLEILPIRTTHQEKWTHYLVPELPRLLRKERPDIIVCYQEEGTISLCWSLLCTKIFSPNTKIGFFSWQNIEIHQKKWHQRFRWFLTKRLSDFFFAGSNEISKLFKENGYKKPIFIQTEIGVSQKIFKADQQYRKNFQESNNIKGQFTIGFAGRFVEEKGIFDLTESLKLLDNIPYKMVWAGDGKEKKTVKSLRPNDIFLGQLKPTSMVEFYNGIDLLILPSKTTPHWKEQFGLVAAQSLACGTPVIGSNSGAIPEVINNNDYIFPEGDIQKLSMKINDYYNRNLSKHNKGEEFYTDTLAMKTNNSFIEICSN